MHNVPCYILGQAQRSYHNVESVDHPKRLIEQIAAAALADADIAAPDVDAVACVDPFSWTYAELASNIATELGCRDDVREFWLPGGGTTPQDLMHEIAQAMAAGQVDVAVIMGGEAMRTRRKASRAGRELPWPPRDKSVSPMRGQKPFTSEWEAQHGLRLPIQSFPLNENALRTANNRSAAEQIQLAAALLHKNATVAADNPHAWFQDAPTAASIGTVSADNRMIAYPYTKRMNAIMDVDQAAALVLVSERFVAQHGVRDRAIAVLGGAGAEEIWNPIQRPDLARSVPMQKAFSHALDSAGLQAADIAAFDFYSCFPSPVQMALAALDISTDDPRKFSLTGGLAYAGGPGNNYVMHSLATAVARLRTNPEERLLITGVGMANTKHAATVLSHAKNIPAGATGQTVYRLETGEQAIDVAERVDGPATLVTYTIEYDRDARASNVIYVLDLEDGRRTIANAEDCGAAAENLSISDPIGRRGQVRWDATAERQYFSLT